LDDIINNRVFYTRLLIIIQQILPYWADGGRSCPVQPHCPEDREKGGIPQTIRFGCGFFLPFVLMNLGIGDFANCSLKPKIGHDKLDMINWT